MTNTSYQRGKTLSRFSSGEKIKRIYNTIIIGAGPGGLMAGRHLTDSLILDQKEEIGKPVQCGEGLSRLTLKDLGIKPNPKWICCNIEIVQRIMPNGKAIGRSHKELCYVLNRTAFEKFLASKCKSKIKLNTKVVDLKLENNLWKVKTDKGIVFQSKYLIGADGCLSVVRRKVFNEKLKTIPAIQYLVKLEKRLDTSIMKIYFDNYKFRNGYAWIFPKSEITANIGTGGRGNLSKKFKEFMGKVVRKEYGSYQLLENKSGLVPSGKPLPRLVKNNALLVGDAAGLIDPIFKGGIRQTMISGKIAAQCILNNQINLYEEKIKSLSYINPKVVEAGKIFYSFNNKVLNEIGEILENKSTSYLKTLPAIIKLLSKPYLRKNFFKIYKFFLIWRKNKDYLW